MADGGEAIGTTLQRRVGPLPVVAWLAVVAVGVAAAIAINRARARRAGGDSSGSDSAPVEPSTGNPLGGLSSAGGGFAVGGGGGSTATGQAVSPSSPFPPAEPTIRTNEDWAQQALRELIARGYSPTLAADVLSRWMGGLTVSAQGAAMIDRALQLQGPPPIPVPPAVIEPSPTPAESGGGGGSPAPAVSPVRVVRFNGGPDGPGSFVALLLYSDGSLGWIQGPDYSRLKAAHGETVLSAAEITSLVQGARKTTGAPTPGYLPSAAQSSW